MANCWTQRKQPASMCSDSLWRVQGAKRSKALRQRWHFWHSWQCGLCKLQILKDARETESFSRRSPKQARASRCMDEIVAEIVQCGEPILSLTVSAQIGVDSLCPFLCPLSGRDNIM